ncbi:hypothetical protein ASPFODRAFT_596761 [Aspergillus luchuensis CBS 106.47]|uniref:Uncharacterized protein n=1 Tax=Aspergillus luchuensis (strain CBS 106.47) TaxID=1137211 RepID=A0A1M3THT8_ASPLC|nr:hypothetical protein ASPFODRAFT_596761 [Aspergillus luchuensis CBS 106.47]
MFSSLSYLDAASIPSIRNIGKTETHPNSSASWFLLYPILPHGLLAVRVHIRPPNFFPINSILMLMLHASFCVRPEVLHSFLLTFSFRLIPEHDLSLLSPLYVPFFLLPFLLSARSRCASSFLLCNLCITCTVHIARDSADKIGIISTTSVRFSCLVLLGIA